MRAVALRNGEIIVRDDVPEPVPEAGQVLVEVKACGICGSDLHFAEHGATMLAVGREMGGAAGIGVGASGVDLSQEVFTGHEFAAEVLAAGPDTQAPAPGTIVTSLPVLLSNAGVQAILYSNTVVGGYSERMMLSAPLLLPVPNGLDPARAALTEPMAVGLHAVNKARIKHGEGALGNPERHCKILVTP